MLEKYKRELVYCTYCPRLCRFSCPVTNAEARETVTPTAKLNLMDLIRRGATDLDEEAAEVFYHCAGCLTCRAYCKHRIDVPEIIEHARTLAVNRGLEPECLERHIETFEEHRNPYGPALAKKLDALPESVRARIGRPADTLYFIGCTTLFHYPALAAANAKLLEAAGIDFAVHADPAALCCGTPSLLTGAGDSFRACMRRLAPVLSNYKRIITGCPSCMATFSIKYPAHGQKVSAEITHTTQLAARLLAEGKIKPSGKYPGRAMYHDPCHLAKYFGVYEEPRAIMSALFEEGSVVEFSWSRDKNYCCGGGGLLPITAPDTARAITERRLAEYREAAPDMLVTACPTCERTFHRADRSMPVMDLITLLADKL